MARTPSQRCSGSRARLCDVSPSALSFRLCFYDQFNKLCRVRLRERSLSLAVHLSQRLHKNREASDEKAKLLEPLISLIEFTRLTLFLLNILTCVFLRSSTTRRPNSDNTSTIFVFLSAKSSEIRMQTLFCLQIFSP